MLSIFKESNYERIKNYLSDDVEKNLFIEMYCKRKSIYNIIKNEKYFKMTLLYKKLIIKNCIDYLNERRKNIKKRIIKSVCNETLFLI
jgi:hypothetical protein